MPWRRQRHCWKRPTADTNKNLSNQTCTNQANAGAKMKCKQDMSAMANDFDKIVFEAAMSREKAIINAVRLASTIACSRTPPCC